MKDFEKQQHELLYGNLTKQLFKQSIPTMSGYMFQALYDMVDLLWIGFISSSAVASMTIISTVLWAIDVFNEIVGTSSVSLLSQYYGAQDNEKTSIVAERTLAFKFIWALAGSIIMIAVLRPLVCFFSKDSEVINYALEYGYLRILFIPIFFSSYSVNTIFRCTGQSQTPMRLLIVSATINMILDPILMFETVPIIGIKGFNLGMLGASIATIIGQTFSLVAGLILIIRGRCAVKLNVKRMIRANKEIDKKLMTIGLPSGVDLFLRNIFNIILMKLISSYGTAVVAVFGIGCRIQNFCMMPQQGFATGSGVLVGTALGSEQIDRAEKCVRKSNIICALVCAVPSILFCLFPSAILSLFLGGEKPDPSGIPLMFVLGANTIILSFMVGYHAAFQGSGLTKPLLVSSFVSSVAVRLPYAFFVFLMRWPVKYLWLCYTLSDIAEVLLRRHFYRQKKWLDNRV